MLKRKDINELFIENVNHLLSTKTFRNRREIVDKLEWDETAMSNVMNGRRQVPEDIAEKLFKLYKDANIGDTHTTFEFSTSHVNEPPAKYETAKVLSASNLMEVPLVNQYAYAGYLSGFKDGEYLESLPTVPFIVDKQYKGKYLCFQIKGDSMEDGTDRSYKEGSIALGRELGRQHWKSKFRIDRYRFIIVHRTDGILIKEIIKHDVERGLITLHSYNPMHEDFNVKLDDVLQLFNVIKVVRDE